MALPAAFLVCAVFLFTSNELTAESARLTKATKMEDHVQVRAEDVARAWEERCVMYKVARSFCQSVGARVDSKVSWVTGGGLQRGTSAYSQ